MLNRRLYGCLQSISIDQALLQPKACLHVRGGNPEMADTADMKKPEDTPKAVSRRKFIQGVIAGGAGVSSATYLFRASGLATAAGAGEGLITLNVNGQQ